ncbi:hypothetical protein [Alkaliphilus sp. B6464]|uniref:hypothetical protein n=1 Tax=Alkaliphilus sp. B6464 TaxID=2731219 RepID=UPI001BA7A715|nr:hypothetical protein [Alkaliphilus sp. B6464]QUH22099.1 hypothetical protein HYG84_19525 [Alkaliphilus sp. B6464]
MGLSIVEQDVILKCIDELEEFEVKIDLCCITIEELHHENDAIHGNKFVRYKRLSELINSFFAVLNDKDINTEEKTINKIFLFRKKYL